LADELVDVGLSVTKVTTLHEVLEFARPPATVRVRQLKRPEEVGRLFQSVSRRKYLSHGRSDLLEVGAGSGNLVNEVFYGEDVVFAEGLLDDGIVGQGNTLFVDLAVTALVKEFADRLDVWLAKKIRQSPTHIRKAVDLPVCNVGLNQSEHLLGSFSDLYENTIVDLEKAEEL
jgi:hypothetical protein